MDAEADYRPRPAAQSGFLRRGPLRLVDVSGLAATCARLRERRTELEQAALARVNAVSDPIGTGDPEYILGLRAAVGTAVDYGLDALETGEDSAPVPPVLLSQARLAARNRVGLDTVMRRYCAGYTLLADFLIRETEREGVPAPVLRQAQSIHAALLDRLLSAITDEYRREVDYRTRSGWGRAERVRRLLDGEPLDASDLGYDLDAHHLGLVAAGPGGEDAVRALSAGLDRQLLLVRACEDGCWAWLGGRRPIARDEIEVLGRLPLPPATRLAAGEPGEGISGWRLSHRQARAALPVASGGGSGAVRYGEVAALTSLLQDELLVTSLSELYLKPLKEEGSAVETLRAYYAAEQNVTSAAAALGVSRQTVSGRLRRIEGRLGAPVSASGPELQLALRLEDYQRGVGSPGSRHRDPPDSDSRPTGKFTDGVEPVILKALG